MEQLRIEPGDRSTILIHYYRAMVGRADIWRTRMDMTTNWAIGATAAVLSFSLGSPAVPHYAVLVAPLLTVSFLLLEARRLTFYHFWQNRALLLENALIRPALLAATPEPEVAPDPSGIKVEDPVAALHANLGRTVPEMSRTKAVARRLRRVYLYLFAVQLLTWGLKLSMHPDSASGVREVVARASIGVLPGPLVISLLVALLVWGAALAALRGGITRVPSA